MTSSIDISGDDKRIIEWLWDNQIPDSGQSSWVQGELLRAVERLRREAQSNGNINWDDRFEMFVDFLAKHLLSEPQFSANVSASIEADLARLKNFASMDDFEDDDQLVESLPYIEDDLYDRLALHVAKFCRWHPVPIPNPPNPAQYR